MEPPAVLKSSYDGTQFSSWCEEIGPKIAGGDSLVSIITVRAAAKKIVSSTNHSLPCKFGVPLTSSKGWEKSVLSSFSNKANCSYTLKLRTYSSQLSELLPCFGPIHASNNDSQIPPCGPWVPFHFVVPSLQGLL